MEPAVESCFRFTTDHNLHLILKLLFIIKSYLPLFSPPVGEQILTLVLYQRDPRESVHWNCSLLPL